VDDIKITSRPLSGQDTSVIMGFPGSGLVGSIALSYMVEQLGFNQIGSMTSKFFPPLVMMSKGVINIPVRIYEKDNFAAILSDIPIHPMICYEVANGLLDWLTQFSVKEIVTIAGIVTNEPEKRVFGVATSDEALKQIEEITTILPMGSISGIAGSILTECKVRNIPALGLLGESLPTPDPRAAAATVDVLSKMYQLDINTQPLVEQAAEIEAAMQRLSEQVRGAEAVQPKEQQLPMYG
jgi:uncharacterized protein